MVGKYLTTYKITTELQIMENQLIDQTGLKKTWIHENAVKNFYNKTDWKILPELQNRAYHVSESYIKREAAERVYMTPEMMQMLKEMAEFNRCNLSIVFYNALLDFVEKKGYKQNI